MRIRRLTAALTPLALTVAGSAVLAPVAPVASADNSRLNSGVVANVYTLQHQAGCTSDIKVSPALRLAAQWHARDVLNNRTLGGDLGSDGSTPQSRGCRCRFQRSGDADRRDQSGAGDQQSRRDQSVVLRPGRLRDHDRLREHRNRRVVGEQPGPLGRRGGLRPARVAVRASRGGLRPRTWCRSRGPAAGRSPARRGRWPRRSRAGPPPAVAGRGPRRRPARQ